MSKKNDYLEKLKAAKEEAKRLASEKETKDVLERLATERPHTTIAEVVEAAKRGKMPESSGAAELSPEEEAAQAGELVKAPMPSRIIAADRAPSRMVRRGLYLVASNGNILI